MKTKLIGLQFFLVLFVCGIMSGCSASPDIVTVPETTPISTDNGTRPSSIVESSIPSITAPAPETTDPASTPVDTTAEPDPVLLMTETKERPAFDIMTAGGTHLSEEELKAWQEFFTKYLMPDMFLKTEFSRPEKVDLGILLHNGLIEQDEEGEYLVSDWTAEEQAELIARLYPDKLDYQSVSRIQKDALNRVLERYIGLTLEETEKIHLEWLNCDEQTDSYYLIIPDAADKRYTILDGVAMPDGKVVIHWQLKLGLAEKETGRQGFITVKRSSDSENGFAVLNERWFFESNYFEDLADSIYKVAIFLCKTKNAEAISDSELRETVEKLLEGGNPIFPYIAPCKLELSGGEVTLQQLSFVDDTLQNAMADPLLEKTFAELEELVKGEGQLLYAIILMPDR